MTNSDYIHFDPTTLTTEVRYQDRVIFRARLNNWGGNFFGIDFSGPYAEEKKMLSLAAGTCLFRDQAEEIVLEHCKKCIDAVVAA